MSHNLENLLSKELLDKAIWNGFHGGYAWKKSDAKLVINEITKQSYAILGGDVWALNNPLAPTDVHSIFNSVIPGKDGRETVFHWHSDQKPGESWTNFVERSKIESIHYIKILDAENSVDPKYKDAIYYNLVFVPEHWKEKQP